MEFEKLLPYLPYITSILLSLITGLITGFTSIKVSSNQMKNKIKEIEKTHKNEIEIMERKHKLELETLQNQNNNEMTMNMLKELFLKSPELKKEVNRMILQGLHTNKK